MPPPLAGKSHSDTAARWRLQVSGWIRKLIGIWLPAGAVRPGDVATELPTHSAASPSPRVQPSADSNNRARAIPNAFSLAQRLQKAPVDMPITGLGQVWGSELHGWARTLLNIHN